MLWRFLSTVFASFTGFEVFLFLAGIGLALGWKKLGHRIRIAALVALLVLAALLLGDGVSRTVSEGIKVFVAAGAVGLALAWRSLPKRTALTALLVLTLVASVNFLRWGPKYLRGEQIDPYDVIHYYMSARYFEEVGYYELYPALALADSEHEDGPHTDELRFVRLQVDGVYERVPVPVALARGREVRENFTEERWGQFKHDLYRLQRDYKMTRNDWTNLMHDRGFNGTPAFLFVARPIVTICPVEGIKILCMIDVVLLALLLWLVNWAYDTKSSLWVLLFLVVTYSTRWPVPGNAFMRYDWTFALGATCCLLKKARPGIAGVAAGWAATMRFFPAVWMLGPAIKGVAGLFKGDKPLRDRFDRRLLTMAGGFLAACLVLEAGALLTVGTEAFTTHTENISQHTTPEELTSRRVGFALAYSYDGSRENTHISKERKDLIKEQKTERTFVAIVIIAALGWALRRRRDDETFAFGVIPFFLLTTASYYYFVARLTLILIHAQGLSKRRNRVGLAVLMGLELISNYIQVVHGNRVVLVGHLSWGLTGYAVLMTGWLVWESHKGQDLDAAGDEGEGEGEGEGEDATPAAEPSETKGGDDQDRSPDELGEGDGEGDGEDRSDDDDGATAHASKR